MSCMDWSSTLRTDRAMTSGWNSAMAWRTASSGSAAASRSRKRVSWPARRVAAATRASPSGSVGMKSRSAFGEMKSTFIPPSYAVYGAASPRALGRTDGGGVHVDRPLPSDPLRTAARLPSNRLWPLMPAHEANPG